MARKMERPRIKDCLPLVNGLWNSIDYQFPEEFDLEPSQLDIIFLSNWSQRIAAPILDVLHDDSSESTMLTSQELGNLADIINGMYKHKWDKLMAVALAEYDPIHNYSDTFEESIAYDEEGSGSKNNTGSHSSTRTDNLVDTTTNGQTTTETYNTTDTTTDTRSIGETSSGTDNTTDGRTITETRNLSNSGSNSEDNEIFGFNSANAVGDTSSSGTNSNSETGTVTTQHSGTLAETTSDTKTTTHSGSLTDTKTGTVSTGHSGDIVERNTGTQTNSGTDSLSEMTRDDKSGTRARSYTKTGNIGNISTQKLLNEEIDLWQYNFIYEMMRDVINFISLPTYECNY